MPTSTSKAEFAHLDAMMATVRGASPRTTAVVQPTSALALGAALDATREGLIKPVLVGDARRIREAAASRDDFAGVPIVDARTDAAAASEAVAMVRRGEVEIVMKGHIHSDEFLRPMLDKSSGLRTAQIMSHVFACYLPQRIYSKVLLLTDGAFNLAPDLAAKRAILENAIALARALGIAQPKVAILAATEEVNPAMQATLDAQALRNLGAEGAFGDALVGGPFAFDNAISADAARTKGIESRVCGEPDILLVPTIEAGNMLYKQMVHFCNAITPGIVLGAAVPIILTSRSDPPEARLASCALAAILAA